MSDFRIFNSYDGTTRDVSAGALVTLHVGDGTLLSVEHLFSTATGDVATALITTNGPISRVTSVAAVAASTDWHIVFNLEVSPPAEGQSNVQHAGFVLTNRASGVTPLGFILIFHPSSSSSGADLALPADVIDVQCDLLFRKVVSHILAQMNGIKVGDNVKFGVVPTRSGAFVGTGIDSITLSLRPVGKFLRDPLEFDNEASPAVAGSGANQYYDLDFALDDDALSAWFSDANAAQEGGDPAGPNVTSLQVAAELRFDESGVITTTDTFLFTLFQSIVAPAP